MYSTVHANGNTFLFETLKKYYVDSNAVVEENISFVEDGTLEYDLSLSQSGGSCEIGLKIDWIYVKWILSQTESNAFLAFLENRFPSTEGFYMSATDDIFSLNCVRPSVTIEIIRKISLIKWHLLSFSFSSAFSFVQQSLEDVESTNGTGSRIFSSGVDILTINSSEHKDISLLKKIPVVYVPLREQGQEYMLLQAMEDRLVVYWRSASTSNTDRVLSRLFIQVIYTPYLVSWFILLIRVLSTPENYLGSRIHLKYNCV